MKSLKDIFPFAASARYFWYAVATAVLSFSPTRYGLYCSATLDAGSSWSSVFFAFRCTNVFSGSRSKRDTWAGTPQPMPARSRAGLPPMYHSKTVHAASGFFVAALITHPVAVMVGSRCLPPFQIGDVSSRDRAATFALPVSVIGPRNQ